MREHHLQSLFCHEWTIGIDLQLLGHGQLLVQLQLIWAHVTVTVLLRDVSA